MAAVPSIKDISSFSPFDDPFVKKQQRTIANASFKAFNAVANALLVELVKMYPTDSVVRFFSKELAELTSDKTKTRVPALNFFREVRKPAVNSRGEQVQYVDLLLARDEQAFVEPIPVMVLRSSGIASKFKNMTPEVQASLWSYVERLVTLSLKAVLSSNGSPEELNKLSRAVILSAASGNKDMAEVASDPAVQESASRLVGSIN
jgi:hypothetical protein